VSESETFQFFDSYDLTLPRTVAPTRAPRVGTCEDCGLYKNCQSPKMTHHGIGTTRVLILGEQPAGEEDKANFQFRGNAGRLLRDELSNLNMHLDNDFFLLNSVNCHNPSKAKPTDFQVRACRSFRVLPTIQELAPTHIWLMGNYPLSSQFSGRVDGAISKMRGRMIPDYTVGAWIHPMYHPSAILRSTQWGEKPDEMMLAMFRLDLKRAVRSMYIPAPTPLGDLAAKVVQLTKFEDCKAELEALLRMPSGTVVSIDYECTSLKPDWPNQRIISVQFCYSKDRAVAMPLQHKNWFTREQQAVLVKLWVQFLEREDLLKVGHNIKFENNWSKKVIGATIKGWKWDTMLNSHLLDNTQGTKALDFQAFVQFGIEDWSKVTAKYMNVPDGKWHNRLEECPFADLLLYGGLDALIGFMLYEKQQAAMARIAHMDQARQLFHDGILVLSEMEQRGFPISVDHFKRTQAEWVDKAKKQEALILNTQEAKLFKKATSHDFRPGNNNDVVKLLFDVLGETPVKATKTGNYAVDESVLEKIGIPITKQILELRHINKVSGTYLDSFLRLQVNGRVYPNSNLHTVTTFRSSMDDPNMQNIPRRREDAMMAIRSGLIPDAGCLLFESDFKSAEVTNAGQLTLDPVLLDYLRDLTTDMHRDEAIGMFRLEDVRELMTEKEMKKLRDVVKNNWTFPLFYGSTHKAAGPNMWALIQDLTVCGKPVTNHMGCGTLEEFVVHAEYREEVFWNKFNGVRTWQKNLVGQYKEVGYIETPLGFRFSGEMEPTNIYNYPIQGTTFHLLLWTLCRMNEERKRRGWKSYPLIQIHDSILWNIYPPELKEVVQVTDEVITKRMQATFKSWMVLPMGADYGICKVNEPLALKKDLKGPELKELLEAA